MSLDAASSVARQALVASQYQIALSSRNVAAADDPTRSRANAVLATTVDGGVRVAVVRRAEDSAVYKRMIEATAATAERDAVLEHLEILAQSVGDPENGTSIGALIGDLEAALSDYANSPDDMQFGRTAIESARDVADKLNSTTAEVLAMRERADTAVAEAVEDVNRLLIEFDELNEEIVKGTITGRDITMDLDRRDGVMAKISEFLGVKSISRSNNDIALFTDGGITLYDQGIRDVTFEQTEVYTATTSGLSVYVDGMAINGTNAVMPSSTGSIVGHLMFRDDIVPTFQIQMDEIAREITDIFSDGVGSLFVNSGGPDYAGTIAVAPDVDPTQGGTVENLRDGTSNVSGDAAYSDRLLSLGDALNTVTTFDSSAELGASTTLMDFAESSAGWVEGLRKTTQAQVDSEAAILTQTSDLLSSITGVNLDDEYAQQLMIERSFTASSRLIGVIDEMFDTLLGIT